MIKINEIFYSIQGESTLVGWPTVFVRTSGCHLRCTYCDTTYAYYEGEKLSHNQILEKVRSYPAKHVCVTGGEPLLQEGSLSLMGQLCDEGYTVSLETSGDLSCESVDPRVRLIIDVKTPDSGEPDRFDEKNLNLENVNIEYKFVICSERDFYWASEFCKKHNLFEQHVVFFSPSFGQVKEDWLAKKILEENSSARLQLQLHKYIWSSTIRGV